jgi:fibro-slime domain-containing protein
MPLVRGAAVSVVSIVGAFLVAGGCGGKAEVYREPGKPTIDAGGGGSTSTRDGGGGSILEIPDSGNPSSCGSACADSSVAEPTCGDGLINQTGEQCDDGNTTSGDGCTAGCEQVEGDFVCPTPGERCVSTVHCGDAIVGGSETCDDGNEKSADGCDARCTLELGWTCPFPGVLCEAAKCGDGLIAGLEECDTLGADAGSVAGCSSTCLIQNGYDCDPKTLACSPTVCGNGTVERGEQCEDGNDRPFDGCYQCRREPRCTAGQCTGVCGDGQRFADEACDDGNTRDGDGCSAGCTIEDGFKCTDIVGQPPPSIHLPVIFRDFVGVGRGLNGMVEHQNFNGLGGNGMLKVVETSLGANGLPVFACPGGDCTKNPGVLYPSPSATRHNMTTPADFAQWYTDVTGVNIPVPGEVVLPRQASGAYLYDSADKALDGIDFFDPLHDIGWVAVGKESQTCSPARNVSFTSETHFWFEYQGGERFDFSGDDDTWVFVNGKLAIDLGGLHSRLNGFFILNDDTDGAGADTADGTANVTTDLEAAKVVDLGLSPGGIYEVSMFQAERNECGSNFTVTLRDFNRPRSQCKSVCGDGIVTSDEACDDGTAKNDGTYGHCAADCKHRGPYCGDGHPDKANGEECDDGVNASRYGGCAPGCILGPVCGDGVVQSGFEQCDDGKNDGGYGECAKNCVYGERCGDGIVQRDAGETCDDGNRRNGDGCTANCRRDNIK